MKSAVRVGDEHEGTCHGNPVQGEYIGGSPDVFVNDIPVVREGDPLIYDCPDCDGTGIANEGSLTVYVNDIPLHRVEDETLYNDGTGQAITGSPDVFVG